MSKGKYLRIFSRQMEPLFSSVYCPSNIFHNTRSFENWGISLPRFSLEIFSHVTRLNQSRAGENI